MRDIRLGAIYLGNNRCRFVVWAPKAKKVEVHLLSPDDRYVELKARDLGYFDAEIEYVPPGATYKYRLNGGDEWPDPASRYQPEGVHGPSAVVDPSGFQWTDQAWSGIPLDKYVIYELHVGTFTPEGTFEAIIPHLPYLKDLGVTVLEILPVSQFPGDRNWGYDGVFPYATQNSYGGPEGFRKLIDAAHSHGLAVILDCVYNHLGPEGNYLGQFGHYFTNHYNTPWGDAINMDDAGSDEVRRYFIENALYWVRELHMDGFRLDATDRIIDESATHFLQALSIAVHDLAEEVGRYVWIIAESDANDVKWLLPPALNGHGMDAQWGDDFHHALHALLTGERDGYYSQFGETWQMAKSFRQNFVYDGTLYSEYRERTHGNSPKLAKARQFVVASQNHDQVGNRATGERLSHLIDFESAKLAAATYLLSPYLPLIFMGEEYAEDAPFQYFTSHTDPSLAEAVSKGRREEFGTFNWVTDVPDPQDEATFKRSKLNHGLREQGNHGQMLDLYRELLQCRRELPALANLSKERLEVCDFPDQLSLLVRRWTGDDQVVILLNFSESEQRISAYLESGNWQRVLVTSDERFGGPGCDVAETTSGNSMVEFRVTPRSAALLEKVTV